MKLKLHGCPYALRDAIYQDCPRLVHGLPGAPCDGCCAETTVDLQDVTPAVNAGTLPSTPTK